MFPPNGDARREARAFLSELARDYEGNRAEDFLGRFDADAVSNFEAFRERVRDFLLRHRQLNVDIIIDTVLVDGAQVAVRARWDRGFINAAGVHKKEKGRCEFILKRRVSGGLAVVGIHGNSPF
jgi:hypothetical protein